MLCLDRSGQSRRAPLVIEPLEARGHLSVSTWTFGTLEPQAGTAGVMADVRLADNGDLGGDPTTAIAVDGVVVGDTTFPWDSNVWDGIESQWRYFVFGVECGDSGAIHLDLSAGSADESGGVYTSIGSVRIVSGVADEGMAFEWADVEVRFYRNGVLEETVFVGDTGADRITEAGSGPLQTVTEVTPGAGDYDEVAVTGSLRLRAAEGIWPGGNDIFGQIQILG
jgi:hypothetical protein